MRKLVTAALAAASLLAVAPAAWASPDPPPTDPVTIEGGFVCQDFCYFEPYTVGIDPTYPKRLIAWVKEQP